MKRYKRKFEEGNLKETNLPPKFRDKVTVNINDLNDLKRAIVRIMATYFNEIKPFNYVLIEKESYDITKKLFSGSIQNIITFSIKDSSYIGSFNIYTPTGFLNKHIEKKYWVYMRNNDMELNIEIKNKGDYK